MKYNSFMEALKGKQHKIDKNKNGEIDSHDFELLRKEETEELGEEERKGTPVPAKEFAKGVLKDLKKVNVKESEELDEIHRMKTKFNRLDPVSAKSVARQKLSNLVKSGHGKGALIANKMRTLNMGDEVDQEDLDALHEVLSKDAAAGDWIHDFVHSTNPKFEGKSKKERIKMALGAYYDTQKKKDGISEGNGYDDNRRGFGKPPREDDEYHVPDPTVKKAKMKKEETVVEGRNEGDVPFDKPYKTVTTPTVKDKSGAVHTPMSRARNLARMALKKMQSNKVNEAAYAGLEKEDKPGKVKTAIVKQHPNGVEGETVEGWKDAKKAVKEDVQKADIPAYLRKAKGEKPLELKDLKRKDTISDPENLARNRGVKESFDDEGNVTSNQITYKEFAMMLEYETVNGKYVHKGTYGGSYSDPEGADDADEKKPKQQPAEKRGRGRPAGAKSGARKITGTSKLFK